ncbi:MAG: TIGR03986 family CRISPR-associated RAMP protein [Candidatus Aminicenantes bacterium]|nr:TIGR03986 family CRISPR-associated RAMP protein [Candidatus Aminicenantes bacterium]
MEKGNLNSSQSPETTMGPISSKGEERFLNPYNFVDVSGPTPRYPFITNEKFHANSGYIDVEVKTVTPLFIPAPGENEVINGGDHKEMRFFHHNGQPLIPSTSLKGLIRSTVETLSNSCFPHDYSGNTNLNYMCRRLNVEEDDDSKEIRNLRPGILKKKGDQWYFIELDQAKVLTVIDRYTPYSAKQNDGEKFLFAAKNRNGEFEKISTKSSTSGINGYINKKRDRGFYPPLGIDILETEGFKVTGINGERLDKPANRYNKRFPYIKLEGQNQPIPSFYAIIREKKEKRGSKEFFLYKVKEVSANIGNLKKLLQVYNDRQRNRDDRNAMYEICQVLLKTSFDIDSKTQDRLFFKFGKIDLASYLDVDARLKESRLKPIAIDEKLIAQFKNLISQRHENLVHMYKDHQLLRFQPTAKDVKDGMLVYYYQGKNMGYHSSKENDSYLTYTQVARAPYRYGIAELIKKQGKSVCSDEAELCPACNMFGGVNIKMRKQNNGQSTRIAIGGKISVGFGKRLTDKGFEEDITLKPLGEPHPSFFQFYILDNRKGPDGNGKSDDYNSSTAKLGRKVYLKHDPAKLNYKDTLPTKSNCTVQLLNPGAVFQFRIHYFNLSNYELGLLLNSLDIKHNGQRLDYQLGMGKSLGLGRIKIESFQVTAIDRRKRYSSLKDDGESEMSTQDIEKYINIFQRIQTDVKEKMVDGKRTEFDPDSLNEKDIAGYEIKLVPNFSNLTYIKEFTMLKRINDGISPEFPIKYPAKLNKKKEMIGFKWFMDEKANKKQRLFKPGDKPGELGPLDNWGQESKK